MKRKLTITIDPNKSNSFLCNRSCPYLRITHDKQSRQRSLHVSTIWKEPVVTQQHYPTTRTIQPSF
jgi:hypothetical protein